MLDGSPISGLRYTLAGGNTTQLISAEGGTESPILLPGNRTSYQFMSFRRKTVYEGGKVIIRLPTKIEFKRSVQTGPGAIPKGNGAVALELLVPKRPLFSPKKPVYFPPRVSLLRKPTVREWTDGTREAPTSFIHARFKDLEKLDVWKKTINEARRRKSVYDERYKLRLAKYESSRKKFVDAYTKAVQPVYAKARSRVSSNVRVDNPFKKMILIPMNDVDLRITRLTTYGSVSFGPPYPNPASPWPFDPTNPRYDYYYNAEKQYPGSNFFNGVQFPGSLALPPQLKHYDRGNFFLGAKASWDDKRDPPGDMERTLRDGVALEMLHSDFIAAANEYVEDIDAKLTRKIFSKIKRNVIHVGNLIGERKQTFDLLLTLYKRISALILLKKGTLKALQSAVSNKKAWADDVLAFKFGVEPLVSDFLSLTAHLESMPPDSPIITVRTNSQKACSFKRGGLEFNGFIEVSYVVKMKSSMDILESLKKWGLTNPMETAWELTPWSFVVDWFLPVGEYISSLTADTGLTFVTGTRKIKMRGTFSTRSPSGFDPNNLGFSKSGNFGHCMTGDFAGEVIDRTVLNKLPSKSKILTFKNPWSWAHGIESLALIVQRLK